MGVNNPYSNLLVNRFRTLRRKLPKKNMFNVELKRSNSDSKSQILKLELWNSGFLFKNVRTSGNSGRKVLKSTKQYNLTAVDYDVSKCNSVNLE